jgi:hypothetical protein
MHDCHLKTLAVNGTGNGAAQTLIEPGVTELDEGSGIYTLERNVKLHIRAINLQIGSAGTIIFKIGDKEIYREVMNAAGLINADVVDLSDRPIKPLTITVTNGVTYIGSIVWNFEFFGSGVAQIG